MQSLIHVLFDIVIIDSCALCITIDSRAWKQVLDECRRMATSRVVLVGHSVGAVLSAMIAERLQVCACTCMR